MKSFRSFVSKMLVITMVLTCFTTISFADNSEKSTMTIDVVSFNDFHGSLGESGKNVGMAKLISVVNDYKKTNPNTVVVSAGDNYQGSALSNLTYGEPVNEMLKTMDVPYSAVGNHEFDWGTTYINQWEKQGDLKFLAANIIDEATGEVVSWTKPYGFTTVGGKSIAFIGLSTLETPTSTKGEHTKGIIFADPAETAQKWVDFLNAGKAEEGTPDLIIALTHIPSFQGKYGSDPEEPVTGDEINALGQVKGLNAIISGHSHQSVAGYINDIPVVQGYKYGRSMSKISFTFNEDGSLKSAIPSLDVLFKRSADITPDEAAAAKFASFEKELKPIMDEVIGQATSDFTHNTDVDQTTPLGEFVCKLMAEKAGVDIAIQNGGGLRRDMPAGDITMGIMYEIMPFDNTLTVVEMTGADLKKNIDNGLEPASARAGSFSGLKVQYDLNQPAGSRISSITLMDGTPIKDDAIYKVVSNDFLVNTKGADGYDFTNVISNTNLQIPIRDAMVDYIKEKGTVSPEANAYELNLTGKTFTTYVVQEGDVLWRIAKKYNTTYESLGVLNQLESVHKIYAGQSLKIAN